MNRQVYLERIAIGQTNPGVGLESLKYLQRQHLLHIPFENLDIHWKRPIILDHDSFYKKIVLGGRGGFCYELNGLFSELLSEIGFRNKLISARVADGTGEFSAEYDHLAILAEVGSARDVYLTDVGFGDFAAEPLKLVVDLEQEISNGIFKITKFDDQYFEVAKKEGVWKSEYIFRPIARGLDEFSGMCLFHQTSPESHFTQGRVCTLMTETGRKTLTERRFIITAKSGEKNEVPIDSEKDFRDTLLREFGIDSTD